MTPDQLYLIRAHCSAREISHSAYAAYWSPGSRDHLTARVHAEFAMLAAELGYRIEKIEAEPAIAIANHEAA